MIELDNVKIYDIEEVANMFKCSTKTVKRRVDDGTLKGNRIGYVWYFTEKQIEEYLEGKGQKCTVTKY